MRDLRDSVVQGNEGRPGELRPKQRGVRPEETGGLERLYSSRHRVVQVSVGLVSIDLMATVL